MSLDITSTFKTSVDARVEGFVLNVDYLENWRCNFIEKKHGRKRCLPRTFLSLDFNFSFCTDFYIVDDS